MCVLVACLLVTLCCARHAVMRWAMLGCLAGQELILLLPLLPPLPLQVSKLIIASEYGYGASGSPPKIPGGATLVSKLPAATCLRGR
jgi:hypothetical protein